MRIPTRPGAQDDRGRKWQDKRGIPTATICILVWGGRLVDPKRIPHVKRKPDRLPTIIFRGVVFVFWFGG